MTTIRLPNVEVDDSEYAEVSAEYERIVNKAKLTLMGKTQAIREIADTLGYWAEWLRKNQNAFHREAIEILDTFGCTIIDDMHLRTDLHTRKYGQQVTCKVSTYAPDYPYSEVAKVLGVHFRYRDERVIFNFTDEQPWHQTVAEVADLQNSYYRQLSHIYMRVDHFVSADLLVKALVDDAFADAGVDTLAGNLWMDCRNLFPNIFMNWREEPCPKDEEDC